MIHDFALALNDIVLKCGCEGIYPTEKGVDQRQFTMPIKIVYDNDIGDTDYAKIIITFDEGILYHRHITKKRAVN